MPSLKNKQHLLPGNMYHVYNRGNNYERIFLKRSDCTEFLYSYEKYLRKIADLYAFALLANHFHFVIRILDDCQDGDFSKEYSRFINHYTYRINKRDGRSGSLFLNPFKRIHINNEDYLKRLIFYIHYNPEKHGAIENFRNSDFSSYKYYIEYENPIIKKSPILNIFGSKREFIDYHNHLHDERKLEGIKLEE